MYRTCFAFLNIFISHISVTIKSSTGTSSLNIQFARVQTSCTLLARDDAGARGARFVVRHKIHKILVIGAPRYVLGIKENFSQSAGNPPHDHINSINDYGIRVLEQNERRDPSRVAEDGNAGHTGACRPRLKCREPFGTRIAHQ